MNIFSFLKIRKKEFGLRFFVPFTLWKTVHKVVHFQNIFTVKKQNIIHKMQKIIVVQNQKKINLPLPRFLAGEAGGVVRGCLVLPLILPYFCRLGYPGGWAPNPPCPPLPLEGVGEGPWDEGVGVAWPPTGMIAVPGGGPYCVLGNGCLGGAPLHTVLVGVAKGVAPVAVTTMAPPWEAFTIADDWKKN